MVNDDSGTPRAETSAMARRNRNGIGQVGIQHDFAPWMQPGARIYNRGDMANHPQRGTITRIYEDQWYKNVEVRHDDGSVHTYTTNSFFPGPMETTARCGQIHVYEMEPDTQAMLEQVRAALSVKSEAAGDGPVNAHVALRAAVYASAHQLGVAS